MNAFFTVDNCPDPIIVRNVKQDDYSYEDYEDTFNTINFQANKPQIHVRSNRGQQSNTWEHFIAAEEITWDYAPHLNPTDR